MDFKSDPPTETNYGRRSVFESDLQGHTRAVIGRETVFFNELSNAKHYINGLDSIPSDPWTNQHAKSLSFVSYLSDGKPVDGSGGNGMNMHGIGKTFGTNMLGMDGVVGEVLVFDTYLSADDIRRVEGWMAWKWNLVSTLGQDANNVPHPYRLHPPVNNNSFTMTGWTLQSGTWDTGELLNNGILISSNNLPITVRQTVSLTFDEVYEIVIDRVDAETGLTIKLKTDVNVKWLSHQGDITNEVDIPHDEGAVFKVNGAVPTYIEIDTVEDNLSITNITLFRKKLAFGTIEELTNSTIKKITGGSEWNAGASSEEYINGQAEGYIQFQIAQSGKSIKIGLTHQDIDYNDILPYEMKFTGTDVSVEDQQPTSYITGDWFRIRHESVNNRIVYQKRDSDLKYNTFHTHSGTTDGRHLYLDISFYHEQGRINDITMVNGGGDDGTDGGEEGTDGGDDGTDGGN
tara:strand:- start:564 stop:1940 length:1377 start_codon:yes stop_codon:yes gene_type:complete